MNTPNKMTLFQQLLEASRSGGRGTTLIATFFINLLSLAFPMMMLQVYDRIIPNRSFSTMFLLFSGVVIALIIELLLKMSRSYINLWSDTKYEHQLGKRAFGHLVNTSLVEYEKTGAGGRLQQINALSQMKGFYNNQLLTAVFDVPFVWVFLLVIGYLGGWLVLVPLVCMVGLALCSSLLLKHWEAVMIKKFAHEDRENNFIIEVLNNVHTAKSMSMETLLMRRYERLQTSGVGINYLTSVQSGDLITLKMIFSQGVIVALVGLGSIYVLNGAMTIGGLAACTLLAGRIMQPMNRALTAFNRWQMINVARSELEAILKLPVKNSNKLLEFGQVKGDIALENVSFRYEDGEQWILKDINLAIPAGEVIGITGRGQAGKTTLMNLLAGMLVPTQGRYLIDNHDVSKYKLSSLRDQIAYLSQRGELFRGTIMDNLSAFDETLVPIAHRFARALGLDKIIAKLPNGFDTKVSDRAVESLPRGMIQRLLIVRALVKKPKVILFDEANMNLDLVSDDLLMEVLKSLKEIATLVIVSHRPSTLKLASKLYELKDGSLKQVKHGGRQ